MKNNESQTIKNKELTKMELILTVGEIIKTEGFDSLKVPARLQDSLEQIGYGASIIKLCTHADSVAEVHKVAGLNRWPI